MLGPSVKMQKIDITVPLRQGLIHCKKKLTFRLQHFGNDGMK